MYATRDDLATRFSDAEIAQLEMDENGLSNEDLSSAAIQDACAEVDSYIAVKYTLPLPNTPTILLRAVCDIARYRLYKDRATEEVRRRYEDAVSWLKLLAKGSTLMRFDPDLTPVQVEAVRNSASLPSGTTYQGGVFGSVMTDKML
jgi:phage gp36-like protein